MKNFSSIFRKKNNSLFVIGEVSGNHGASLNHLKKLILNAKKSGVDAIKLQTFKLEKMTMNINKKIFSVNDGPWKGKKLFSIYKKSQLPWKWHDEIFNYTKSLKMHCFSTPFDADSVDFLEKLNCPVYKISSFELTDIFLLEKIAKTKKPVILSTGTSDLSEIRYAINILRKNGNKKLLLLHCISEYPAEFKNSNIQNIKILKKKFNLNVGLSDHSKDDLIAGISYMMGARVFEKHIKLGNKKTVDDFFSLSPKKLTEYINNLKLIEFYNKQKKFKRTDQEIKNRKYRRSFFVKKFIKKGEKINLSNVHLVRPNVGAKPKDFYKILNKKAKKNLLYGEPLFIKNLA